MYAKNIVADVLKYFKDGYRSYNQKYLDDLTSKSGTNKDTTGSLVNLVAHLTDWLIAYKNIRDDVNAKFRQQMKDNFNFTFDNKPTQKHDGLRFAYAVLSSPLFKSYVQKLPEFTNPDETLPLKHYYNNVLNLLKESHIDVDPESSSSFYDEKNESDPDRLIEGRQKNIAKAQFRTDRVKRINQMLKDIFNEKVAQRISDEVNNITRKTDESTQRININYDEKIKEMIDESKNLKEEEKARLIDEMKRERDEALSQLKADEYKKLNDLVAKAKHKALESKRHDLVDAAVDALPLKPDIDQRVRDAYKNGDYKLTDDELMHTLLDRKVVGDQKSAKALVSAIRLYSTKQILKDKQKIARFAQIGAYDLSNLNSFPANVQDEINKAIVEKSEEENKKRNIKYMLPVEFIDYKSNDVKQKYVNPMLFRGAYSLNK